MRIHCRATWQGEGRPPGGTLRVLQLRSGGLVGKIKEAPVRRELEAVPLREQKHDLSHIMRITTLILAALIAAPLSGQDRPGGGRDVTIEGTSEPGIAWYGVLEHARQEAARTGKPILLMSGAPACSGVPGMW